MFLIGGIVPYCIGQGQIHFQENDTNENRKPQGHVSFAHPKKTFFRYFFHNPTIIDIDPNKKIIRVLFIRILQDDNLVFFLCPILNHLKMRQPVYSSKCAEGEYLYPGEYL